MQRNYKFSFIPWPFHLHAICELIWMCFIFNSHRATKTWKIRKQNSNKTGFIIPLAIFLPKPFHLYHRWNTLPPFWFFNLLPPRIPPPPKVINIGSNPRKPPFCFFPCFLSAACVGKSVRFRTIFFRGFLVYRPICV